MSSSPTPANGSSKTARAAESPRHLILQMALRDVSVLFRTPWIIITRALSFIIQLFVFAFLISGLIHIPGLNFFEYYAIGSVVATIASISSHCAASSRAASGTTHVATARNAGEESAIAGT